MIERNGKQYDVSCDKCASGFVEVVANNFVDCVSRIKELGWRLVRGGSGDWSHHCPECTHDH